MFARKAAAACGTSGGYSCDKPIHVGIFFDGTNNNLERDKAEQPPSHTSAKHTSYVRELACA